MKTIKDIEEMGEGTLVTGDGEYAILRYSNDHPYYGMFDEHNLDQSNFDEKDLDEAIEVSDINEDHWKS